MKRTTRSHYRYLLVAWVNGLICAGIMLRAIPNDQPAGVWAWLVGLVLMVGQSYLLALATGATPWLLDLLGLKKVAGAIAGLLYSLLVWVMIIESFVYGFFRFHINEMVWALLTGDDIAQILHLPLMTWMVAFGLLALAYALEIFLYRFSGRLVERTDQQTIRIASSTMAAFVLAWGATGVAEAVNDIDVLARARVAPWYQPLPLPALLSRGDNTNMHRQFKGARKLQYPLQPMQCQLQADRPNVLFILVDSLRRDVLHAETMPNTFRFAEPASRYTEHISGSNSTQFGVFSLFYGLPGTYWRSFLRAETSSVLIDEFKKADYQFWLHPSAALNNPAFDRTIFASVRDQIAAIHPPPIHQRDVAITDDFLSRLQARKTTDAPYVGLLFYDAAHAFDPPPGHTPFLPQWESVAYERLSADTEREPFFNRYRNAIHFIDQQLARVYDALESTESLTNTVVVFTSDHGQSFNELHNNIWNHSGSYQPHEIYVPFWVRWPGPTRGTAPAITHTTTHYDLVPTLMQDVLGCSNPASDYSMGTHLDNPNPEDRLVYLHGYGRSALLAQDYETTWVWEEAGRETFDAHGRWQAETIPPREQLEQLQEALTRWYK